MNDHLDIQVIYTCPKKGQAHRKTTLHIDWSKLDRDALIVLARGRLIDRLQRHFILGKYFPEVHEVDAADFVHMEYSYGEYAKRPTGNGSINEVIEKRKEVSQFDNMLAALSPEERATLLGQLELL